MQQHERTRSRIIDTREPEEIRQKLLEYGWEQKALHSGDYFFLTHDFLKVGITRKAIPDLLNSIGERFSGQLEEMLDFYDIRIMLLEGSWKTVNPSNQLVTTRGIQYTTWSMVWNYIRRWQDKGITVELTVDEGHTIQRLNELYALYQKSYSISANTKKFTDDRILAFPSGCRGKTAEECIKVFGNIKGVANATKEMLSAVNGLGNKKVELVYNHFNKIDPSQPKPLEFDNPVNNEPTQGGLI